MLASTILLEHRMMLLLSLSLILPSRAGMTDAHHHHIQLCMCVLDLEVRASHLQDKCFHLLQYLFQEFVLFVFGHRIHVAISEGEKSISNFLICVQVLSLLIKSVF